MKKFLSGFTAALVFLFAVGAGAQLMYGNTFPFWNVTGPLSVTGVSTLAGDVQMTSTATTTGVHTFLSTLASSLVTESTSSTTGAVTTAGGIGVAKSANFGSSVIVGNRFILAASGVVADNAACTAGTISWGSGAIYVCVKNGQVQRATLADF